jgi:hypothetical protein
VTQNQKISTAERCNTKDLWFPKRAGQAGQGDAEMPRKGRSNEEIVHALHQVEGGEKVTEVCRRLGVNEQT